MNKIRSTYYEILEVAKNSDQAEITRAYDRAKSTYAMDNPALYSVFTPQEAKELLQLVEEAYTVLGNAAFRSRYDEMLSNSEIKVEEISFRSIVGSYAKLPTDRAKAQINSDYPKNDILEQEIKTRTDVDGAFIKKVREYKKSSIEDLSEITKINMTYLKALEADRYSDLPAAVFVRGYVSQIARILGLNEKAAVESYMNRYKSSLAKK